MAELGCSARCTCVIADDGIVIGTEGQYILDTGRGRRSTVVAGVGTLAEPYTVTFIDSEPYRPESSTNQNLGFNLSISSGVWVLIDFSLEMFGQFQFIGASVTFAANSTGERGIAVLLNKADGLYEMICGYKTDATTEAMTISTSGFYPGINSPDPGTITRYIFACFQSSGSTIGISDERFWLVSI